MRVFRAAFGEGAEGAQNLSDAELKLLSRSSNVVGLVARVLLIRTHGREAGGGTALE